LYLFKAENKTLYTRFKITFIRKALAFYKAGCFQGDTINRNTKACTSLGRLYSEGLGSVDKNETKALALYKLSCSSGQNSEGCVMAQEFGYSSKAAEDNKTVDNSSTPQPQQR